MAVAVGWVRAHACECMLHRDNSRCALCHMLRQNVDVGVLLWLVCRVSFGLHTLNCRHSAAVTAVALHPGMLSWMHWLT
jgi:hypothetical protein